MRLAVLASVALLAVGCFSRGERSGELLVFAAASLAHPLEEVEVAFERNTGIEATISYGGSQALAQQIASGAPAGVFLSAGEAPVLFLQERGEVEGEPAQFLRNRLVVAVRREGGPFLESIEALLDARVGRIAVADPELAPAGRYAKESLVALGLWETLLPKMVYAADVRAALAYVESGNVKAAFVYATDAAASPSVAGFDVLPQDSHSPVVYPAAVLAGSGGDAPASRFVEYLRSGEAQEVFAGYGFITLE